MISSSLCAKASAKQVEGQASAQSARTKLNSRVHVCARFVLLVLCNYTITLPTTADKTYRDTSPSHPTAGRNVSHANDIDTTAAPSITANALHSTTEVRCKVQTRESAPVLPLLHFFAYTRVAARYNIRVDGEAHLQPAAGQTRTAAIRALTNATSTSPRRENRNTVTTLSVFRRGFATTAPAALRATHRRSKRTDAHRDHRTPKPLASSDIRGLRDTLVPIQ